MVETIDWTDVIALKVMAAMAVVAVAVCIIALPIVLLVLALPKRWTTWTPRPRPLTQREVFIASLPKTKAGGLFPKGKRDLAEYDRSAL